MATAPSLDELRAVTHALAAAVGPALVLDRELRVIAATPSAEALIGQPIPLHASAAKVLCRKSPKRELAHALAEGRPIEARIPHPGRDGDGRTVHVRSIVFGRSAGTKPGGFLLLLDEGFAGGAEVVSFRGMWTQSAKMRDVFRLIERVAPEDVTVLLRGETGTGKELVARALHTLSHRASGPFRALNCAALPPTLLESELFGHVRGAFTGAVRDAQGHFQLASGGTLFLDEIGELPLELQAKLLRVLETRSVLPVGAQKAVPVDVRIVSATHRSLRKDVDAGRFRADLMYRLRVIPIFLPALRERREDIALLCEKLVENANQKRRRKIERIAPAALSILERYDWPGNVRELENVLAYAYTVGDGPLLQVQDILPEILGATGVPSSVSNEPVVRRALDDESQQILAVLERTRGNKNRAAKILGVSRVTLWRRLRELERQGAVS